MDSKLEALYTKEEELPPPAYSDSTHSTYGPPTLAPTSQYYSSQIQNQLGTLTSQIASVETQRKLLSNAQDEHILSLLTNDIQIYLSDMTKTGLKKGILILVPSKGLKDEKAVPSEFQTNITDEFNRLVRVKDKEGENNGDTQEWFWDDEDMAKRLAKCLQPQQSPKAMKLPRRKEEPKTGAGSSRGFWRRNKRDNETRPPLEQVASLEASRELGSKRRR